MLFSKVEKYGSRSDSLSCCDRGGNRAYWTWGVVCDAADAMVLAGGGEVGVPDAEEPEVDRSFAL